MSSKILQAGTQQRRSSVDRAYVALREMAIEFSIKPGERLNEVELAGRLKMSRVPVREAMNRLVSEGLLTVVPNQGFSCRRLSVSEITALYEVRGDLETAAALLVPSTGDKLDVEGLSSFASAMLEDVATASTENLVERDEVFHLRMVGLAGNQHRVGLLQNINARIRFVRRMNLDTPERMRRSLEEHISISLALQRGDGVGAAQLLRHHLALSAEEAARSVNRGLARIYAYNIS